jgi:hypothetical protein
LVGVLFFSSASVAPSGFSRVFSIKQGKSERENLAAQRESRPEPEEGKMRADTE